MATVQHLRPVSVYICLAAPLELLYYGPRGPFLFANALGGIVLWARAAMSTGVANLYGLFVCLFQPVLMHVPFCLWIPDDTPESGRIYKARMVQLTRFLLLTGVASALTRPDAGRGSMSFPTNHLSVVLLHGLAATLFNDMRQHIYGSLVVCVNSVYFSGGPGAISPTVAACILTMGTMSVVLAVTKDRAITANAEKGATGGAAGEEGAPDATGATSATGKAGEMGKAGTSFASNFASRVKFAPRLFRFWIVFFKAYRFTTTRSAPESLEARCVGGSLWWPEESTGSLWDTTCMPEDPCVDVTGTLCTKRTALGGTGGEGKGGAGSGGGGGPRGGAAASRSHAQGRVDIPNRTVGLVIAMVMIAVLYRVCKWVHEWYVWTRIIFIERVYVHQLCMVIYVESCCRGKRSISAASLH